MDSTDQRWMRHALELAEHSGRSGEVPVGAIIVINEQVIAQAWNQPISDHDPTAHAEIRAIRMAALIQQNYRLPESTLYVTLEPCLMCYGALINARVSRLVYGARDKRFGVIHHLTDDMQFNHKIQITGGVLDDECVRVLSEFFKTKRKTAQADIAE